MVRSRVERVFGQRLLVARDDLTRVKVDGGGEASLEPGQARFAVERGALTANHVTYALMCDPMERFLPAPEGWGCVPVWGVGRCVASASGVEVGQRAYGEWPLAEELVVEVEARPPDRLLRADSHPHNPTVDAVDAVEAWVERVRAEGAVTTKTLLEGTSDRAALLEALSRQGLERGERHVRVPLLEQLEGLLAAEGEVLENGLFQRLAGTESKDEVAHAVEVALARGAAVRAIGAAGAVVLARTADVVPDDVAEALAVAVPDAHKRIKAAQKKGLPLHRSILEGLAPDAAGDLEAQLLEAIGRRRGPLVPIPELVREIGGPLDAVHRTLFALAEGGRVELRPESGVGSLTEEDAGLCPRTPEGVCLSYLRLLP